MQDALLIYLMIANLRNAGGFHVAAHWFQQARTLCATMGIAIERNWKAVWRAVMAAIGRYLIGPHLAGACGSGASQRTSASPKSRSRAAIDLMGQCDWLQALTRLENYVASMS
jgi:hypothetical protein